MTSHPLLNISPLDGRYHQKLESIGKIFSEYNLIAKRVHVEIAYLDHLSQILPELNWVNTTDINYLMKIIDEFELKDAERIKEIEQTTNHDVKAVEYYLREKVVEYQLEKMIPFIHFGLTSNDINSVVYGIQMGEFRVDYTILMGSLMDSLETKIEKYGKVAMLSRTHGQPASPTTLGKELKVFLHRLNKQMIILNEICLSVKFGGAVGNLNAHYLAYPDINWEMELTNFLSSKFGLNRDLCTTQIDNYDNYSQIFDAYKRINTVLIDFCQDIWLYISINYFKLRVVENEVGSSTMPHKVNPIDFENAEGNLGMANCILEFLSRKLPISRYQRDLTDSTCMRNVGVAFGHTVLAIKSVIRGLGKLEANLIVITEDLVEKNWIVVAEGLQTILRREGMEDAYERVKELTRGHKSVGQTEINEWIEGLDVNETVKEEMMKVTPYNYLGNSDEM